MNWIIVPEYISLLFVFIMLFFSREIKTERTLKTRLFRLFHWFVFFEIILSIISIVFIENHAMVPGLINSAVQMLYFLAAPILPLLFVFYLIAVIWEDRSNIQEFFRIAAIPYFLFVPLVIINAFTGLLYKIDAVSGFSYGPGFLLTYFVPAIYLLSILYVAFYRRKKMDPFLRKVMFFFPILSILLLGVQVVFPEVILSSTTVAAALLIMFLNYQKDQEALILQSGDKYKRLFELESDALFLLDKETGMILEANVSASELYGYSQIELKHLKHVDMSAEPEGTVKAAREMNEQKIIIPVRYHKRKDGTVFPVEIASSLFIQNNREVLLVSIRNITERKKVEGEIKHLSYHDYLTGLYNRTFFEEELVRLSVDRQLPISIIMGDINGLKLINDSFGHKNGDKLIIKIANILKKCCREEDIIARVGGDEFCILSPQSNHETVQRICNNIYRECKEQEKAHEEALQFISISLGATTRTSAHESMEIIMKEAEAAMYKHKLLETKSLRSSIVSSIMSTLRERYIETEEHSQRMQELCQRIGHALGISNAMIDDLKLLAVLHDIGKIAISDALINKKEKLTDEEWKEMSRHCEIGFHITQSTLEFQNISENILSHHEKWDGSGYPNQLIGETIPLLSRIISIVDAYDAMTNNRPYRNAFSEDEAVSEIKRFSGTQFDPKIAKVFVEKVLGKQWN
ncbi:MAG: diguanylate cyclase [Clostridia bacterium]